MPTLRVQFPFGRYHATPWGHHVNEGLVEWPPCPWRLLRALIACGFNTQRWQAVPPVAATLIEKLAATLPHYHLPEAGTAHSRHYMPTGSLNQGRENTTLVFDTWADVGGGELLIHWDCELTQGETDLLGNLACSLGYLGRAESRVEAELLPGDQPPDRAFNAFPHQEGKHPGAGWEQLSLMAPVPVADYAAWRQTREEQINAEFPLPEGKKKLPAKDTKARDRKLQSYPDNLLNCLTRDTKWWKQQGWSLPPGSQRVLYWRLADALQVGVPLRQRADGLPGITTVLLSLTTPTGNRSALPPVVRTLPQAELFQQAIRGRIASSRVHCPELTGKDSQGTRLADGHAHAHYLPIDLDGDGRLDHLLIYAPTGLGAFALRLLRTQRETWTKGGAGELQLAVAGVGNLEMLRQLPHPWSTAVSQLLGSPQGATEWVSATPFVPPRFIKASVEKYTLAGQVNAELESRSLPTATEVEVLPEATKSMRHFITARRRGGPPPPNGMGYALRLRFAEPVSGLLTLGYASHFGLGRFAADHPLSADG